MYVDRSTNFTNYNTCICQITMQWVLLCLLFIFSALLLNSIISAFKPEFVAVRAVQFTDMIKECEDTGFPKVKPLSSDQIFSFFCVPEKLQELLICGVCQRRIYF